MKYHIIGFALGFLLDLCLGDPHWLPHPIVLIGKWISVLEKKLLQADMTPEKKRRRGYFFVFLVCLTTAIAVSSLLLLGYYIHPWVGCTLETIMTYQILATKCLRVESMKVYDALSLGTLEDARKAVSMIVGRDTEQLDEIQVTKAAVETVAENTSDGVIAPMLCLALGGPILGFLYKAVNTMDSMVGYKNEKYFDFGRGAAICDDVINYIPARISAWLMMISCLFLGKDFQGKQALAIYRRDRYQHASPNSAQTEAACAGALGIQLAGDASYFGQIVKKPFIGDAIRPVEKEDIKRANRLLYASAILCEMICLLVMGCIYLIIMK